MRGRQALPRCLSAHHFCQLPTVFDLLLGHSACHFAERGRDFPMPVCPMRGMGVVHCSCRCWKSSVPQLCHWTAQLLACLHNHMVFVYSFAPGCKKAAPWFWFWFQFRWPQVLPATSSSLQLSPFWGDGLTLADWSPSGLGVPSPPRDFWPGLPNTHPLLHFVIIEYANKLWGCNVTPS